MRSSRRDKDTSPRVGEKSSKSPTGFGLTTKEFAEDSAEDLESSFHSSDSEEKERRK
jgi:hypothetical protein